MTTERFRHGYLLKDGLDVEIALAQLLKWVLTKKDIYNNKFEIMIRRRDVLHDGVEKECIATELVIEKFEAKHESNGSVASVDKDVPSPSDNKEVESKS